MLISVKTNEANVNIAKLVSAESGLIRHRSFSAESLLTNFCESYLIPRKVFIIRRNPSVESLDADPLSSLHVEIIQRKNLIYEIRKTV